MSGSVPALWRFITDCRCYCENLKTLYAIRGELRELLVSSWMGWWRTFEMFTLCVMVNLELNDILIAFNGVPLDCLLSFQRFIVIDFVVFDTISVDV